MIAVLDWCARWLFLPAMAISWTGFYLIGRDIGFRRAIRMASTLVLNTTTGPIDTSGKILSLRPQ